MFCSQCGSRILENSRFCGGCGAKVSNYQEEASILLASNAHTALVCTQCGSNKLSRVDDVCVCSSCGTQYSVSTGTIKIDNSDQLESFVQLAYFEINGGNGEKALSLSNKALEIKHNYYQAWSTKAIASALLSDTNTVIPCFEYVDTYCSVPDKKNMLSELYICCFFAYMKRMEKLIDSSCIKDPSDFLMNLGVIKMIVDDLLVFVLKLDKQYYKNSNEVSNYVFDYISRLNCLNEMIYMNSKLKLTRDYLQIILDIGDICKSYLKIARHVDDAYFIEGMLYMIKGVYSITWQAAVRNQCENDSKLRELLNQIDKEYKDYLDD